MNLNIIGYIVYLVISAVIITNVGRICYRNGNVFIQSLLKKDLALAFQINRLLLIGYCLLNIGYSALTLVSWNKINDFMMGIEVVTKKISIIVLAIAILHYLNILIIKKYVHKLL